MPITVLVSGSDVSASNRAGLVAGGVKVVRELAQPSTATITLEYPPMSGFANEPIELLLPSGHNLLLPDGNELLLPSGGGAGTIPPVFVPLSVDWPGGANNRRWFGGVLYEVGVTNIGAGARRMKLSCQGFDLELQRSYTRSPVVAAVGDNVATVLGRVLAGWMRGVVMGSAGALAEAVEIESYTTRRSAIGTVLGAAAMPVAAYVTESGDLQLAPLTASSTPVATIEESDVSEWHTQPLLRTYRTVTVVLGASTASVTETWAVPAGLADGQSYALPFVATGDPTAWSFTYANGIALNVSSPLTAVFSVSADGTALVVSNAANLNNASDVRSMTATYAADDARFRSSSGASASVVVERLVRDETLTTQAAVTARAAQEHARRSAEVPVEVRCTLKPRPVPHAATIGDVVLSRLGLTERTMLVAREEAKWIAGDTQVVQRFTLRRGDLAGDLARAS